MKELYGYDLLIEDFLNRKITAVQFEEKYLEKYLGDKDPINEELFLILDWLFAEVDFFSNDPEVFPDSHVTEEQLRDSAAKVLQELRAL